jgi:hypothetical protein
MWSRDGEKPISASSRSKRVAAALQVAHEMDHRRFCYAAPLSHGTPAPSWRAHGCHATCLPDPAQRPVRHVGDGAHGQPQGAAAGDGGKPATRRRPRMDLHDNPTKFLSTVQIGITSIGVLNGIVGEAAFAQPLAHWLERSFGLAPACADISATALVVVIITFLTIIFGELVPKRLGQMYPETVARLVAAADELAVDATRPFVWLLSACTEARAAPAGHPRRPVAQRDRRRDRRQPGRGRGRRRDRGAGAPDGAQRVPPGRPPDRLDDDPARRDRLARRRSAPLAAGAAA